MRWLDNTTHGEVGNKDKVLFFKLKGKCPLRRDKITWKDNIKMEKYIIEWNQLAQKSD
jgi:hypothetical protein